MPTSPRDRRLKTDLEAIRRLVEASTILDVRPHGDPPERYQIRFKGQGVFRDDAGAVRLRDQHQVDIAFHVAYPRVKPDIVWRTPIWHPNVAASGLVCIGGYGSNWVPSVGLDELVEMLWDICRYANYDVGSPYNHEASRWARSQKQFEFPLDPRPLRDKIALANRTRGENVIRIEGGGRASPPPAPSGRHAVPVSDQVLYIGPDGSVEERPSSARVKKAAEEPPAGGTGTTDGPSEPPTPGEDGIVFLE